jgi:bla regulator protein BlaR1
MFPALFLTASPVFESEDAVLSYVEIALINAVIALPLALLAGAAGRLLRRPALTHLLWVLVLVKFITPPVWQIPLVDRDWVTAGCRQLLPRLIPQTDLFERSPRGPLLRDSASVASPKKSTRRPRTLADQEKRSNQRHPSFAAVISTWLHSENLRQLVSTGLLMIWAAGAFCWFSIQGFRCLRFSRSLSRGHAAIPDLQRFSDGLAHRLGLAHSPTVWLMPGVMSPMLWGSGQSTLLIFPESLLDRLSEQATGTLLTHELAHYRRRDHWVRIVALLGTGIFWWHPVTWWARREIEAAEEECCDALVITAGAAPPKQYAEAILEAVDFLAGYQIKLPPLATGLGQVSFLRQRLTWIMRGPRRQDLGYHGRVLCVGLACTLPLQPTWLGARTPLPTTHTPLMLPPLPSPTGSPAVWPSVPLGPASQPDTAGNLEVIATPALPETPRSEPRAAGMEVRAHSSDGRFVVMGNKAMQRLVDLNTARDFDLTDFVITAMAFATNSHHFVSIGQDGFLRIWNAETFEVCQAWQTAGGAAKSVDISADGRLIATGGRDGIVRVWNVDHAQPIRELPRELAPVNCVRFSPDGKLLAVATGDWMSPQTGRIAVIEVERWAERTSMNWNSPAAAVAFRPDGESLMSGDWQGRVARWSVSSGELLGLSSGHKDLMTAAEFSPNGSRLAEIDVPDLQPEPRWAETEGVDQFNWFIHGWSLTSRAQRSTPARRVPVAP